MSAAASITVEDLRPELWADPFWRLNNLYWIVNEHGKAVVFKMNDEQIDLYRNLHTRNLILKARQLGFCLDPSTRILTADLKWVRIDSLRAGDEVVAVDEHPPGGRGKARRMRTATVQAAVEVHRMAYRIKFDDGREVVCTGRHPWLSRKAGTQAEWRSIEGKGNAVTGRIKVGTQIRWVTKPWDAPTAEDGWFGGMLDGEGSISRSNSSAGVNVSQRVGPVWDRLIRYACDRGYNACVEGDAPERPSKHGKTPVPKLAFGRMDEMFRLIGQTRPTRFIGNRFWEGRELPGKRNGDVGWATVTSIEPIGEQTMIDLQTSAGTYIAEGFVSHNTTLICILALDQCLFNKDFSAGIIAHNREDAEKFFRNKVLYAYDRLPELLKRSITITKKTESQASFSNGSSLYVSTSFRGGTLQLLHVSEFGKICRKYPEKAKEIVTGAFESVAAGNILFVESTAEGAGGYFYDYSMDAYRAQQEGHALSKLDWRLHFYPWYRKAAYSLDPAGVTISDKQAKRFREIEAKIGVKFTPEQQAWWVKKRQTLLGDMGREYPATPEEAFEQAVEGAIYGEQMTYIRENGRITSVPYTPGVPVNTFWDLGAGDSTAIWFHQRVGLQNRWIYYNAEFMKGTDWWWKYLTEWADAREAVWGTHYMPHDAEQHRQGQSVKTIKELFEEAGMKRITVVDRVTEIERGIALTRKALPADNWFDKDGCADGIKCLDAYQYEWDSKLGRWKDNPLHNWASHGSDAWRQFAQGYVAPTLQNPNKRSTQRSWRVS